MNFKNNKTPNSQDLPDIVKLNFAISILSTKDMSKNKSLVGKKPYLFALNEVEGFDIDSKFEFDFEIILPSLENEIKTMFQAI